MSVACHPFSSQAVTVLDEELSLAPYTPYRGAVEAHLRQHYERVRVASDGNCLFRALSVGLFGTDARHDEVRNETCEYLRAHQGGAGMPITNELLELMAINGKGDIECLQPGAWGNSWNIVAAAHVY